MDSFGTLLEVTDDLPETGLERSVMSAYASENLLPALVIVRGGTEQRERVDRALDRAVSRYGIRFPGVLLLNEPSEAESLNSARKARRVVAGSGAFQQALRDADIPFLTPEEHVHHLEGSAQDPAPVLVGS